ncbi:MAG: hypothetical protein HY683_09955 [Chloroflexi bacterium]|nr:hypothetical protein [Chloroflexota bacterium]
MFPAQSAEQDQQTKVFDVLDRYFKALETDTVHFLMPDPGYHWKRQITIEEMRTLLAELDEYWWNQRGYPPLRDYDAGPDLSRLPDHAVMALAQELDALW